MTQATADSGEWQDAPKGRRLGWFVIVVAVAAAVILGGVFPFRQMIDQQRQVAATQEKLATLEAENASLADDAAALETPSEIERIAREDLGLVRPGETSFSVENLPQTKAPGAADGVDDTGETDRSLFTRVWDFLTGRDLAS